MRAYQVLAVLVVIAISTIPAVSAEISFNCTGNISISCDQIGDILGDPETVHWWVWGDGTTTSAINASHTYSGPGSYTISLIVENETGAALASYHDYVTVPAVQTVIINPSVEDRCPWWHFGFWCIK